MSTYNSRRKHKAIKNWLLGKDDSGMSNDYQCFYGLIGSVVLFLYVILHFERRNFQSV